MDDLFLSYIYASSESAIVSFHGRASSLGTSLNVNASRGELQTQVLGSSGKLQVLRPNGTMEQVDIPPEFVWGTNTGYMWLVPELSYNIGFQVISAVRPSFLDCGKISESSISSLRQSNDPSNILQPSYHSIVFLR